MSDPADILDQAAATYRQRRGVYGEAYRKVGAVMAALFPDGVTLVTEEDHNRYHLFMLEIVKITRYSHNFGTGGHDDSQLDLSVYGAMLLALDQEVRG